MVEQLREAWRTNNRITLHLLQAIPEEALGSTLPRRGGRDVGRQFAHLHDVRLYQLENRAKELAAGLDKFQSKGAPKVSPSKRALHEALTASGAAIETFLVELLEGVPGRRGFRKGIFTTLSYLVSHESHHTGSIVLTLKQCGHPVERSAAYRLWDWDRM